MDEMPPTSAESRARYHIREIANRKGWNLSHPRDGGDVLEENEIVAHFPNIGLGLQKPDFLFCIGGNPVAVLEAKNEANRSDVALEEAIVYANLINAHGQFSIKVAIGASGTHELGFIVLIRILNSANQ